MGDLNERVDGTGLDIGFLCHGWPPLSRGGVETHAQDLAREFLTRGHRVHVLTLDGTEGLTAYTTADSVVEGVRVRRMAYRYQDHGALADVVRSDKASDVIHAWLAETPCDVVHVHHVTGFGMSALQAVYDVGQPLVMTLHDYWSRCPRGQMLRWDGEVCATAEPETCATCIAKTWGHLMPSQGGRAVGPADEDLAGDAEAAAARTKYALAQLALPHRLYIPSEAARSVFAANGVDPARIEVCENGIRIDELREAVARAKVESVATEDGVQLGVLGSVQPSKGVLELAKALLEADVPVLNLDVWGPLDGYHGDTSYVDELRALAASDDRIRLRGTYERGELASVLAHLHGVAAPSRWNEVFGLTVREARVAGLPVLVSDKGGLPSAAQGGAAGIVVPSDDREAWKQALWAWGADPAQRDEWMATPSDVRSVRDMMLQLERSYVETIVEETGLEPNLAQPLEGGAAADSPPAGASAVPATHEPSAQPEKKGFFKRLFGG